MKFAMIQLKDRPVETARLALIDSSAGRAWPLEAASGMLELIHCWDAVKGQIRPDGGGVGLREVRVLPPIPKPARNIFCVGKNYHDHAQEFARSGYDTSAKPSASAIPKAPIIFTKAPECVVGHLDSVRYPTGVSEQVDYEAELGVVIGKGGRSISPDQALDHIWGYTIINDVTARDLQARHQQWFLGKSMDTFCPMGPWIVTADEIRPDNLRVQCWVNGELRQDGQTKDLIFDVPTLIATISAGMTLNPGDIIATGTPAGVGIGFDPPRFLKPGDEVSIEISGIGRLTNRIV